MSGDGATEQTGSGSVTQARVQWRQSQFPATSPSRAQAIPPQLPKQLSMSQRR
ncbi:cleavage stimulation factor subunit 3 [Homo sapiens]|uniref:Cleavage stimulation factor subunit 3 n=1 Tax=Homo sapiens TaxID=9606 RepID=E9PNK2_HUMAN|nr:cleavage stimulation factor subunit 3 [Homo sapiens]KAI4070657.1 cleavage stimulation factor subunit 3 [Homo sapiens]